MDYLISKSSRAQAVRSLPSRVSLRHGHPKRSSHTTRCFSTVVSTRTEDVRVSPGSSGDCVLNIHHPLSPADDGPVLLYFPRGPLLADGLPDEQVAASLASMMSTSTVVQINYRFDADHKFPWAIHDSLAAYDWVLENIISPAGTAGNGTGVRRFSHSQKIGVCGELVGGSLASAVALTECRLGKARVSAAAVNSPILDWTFGLNASDEKSSDFELSQSADATAGEPPHEPKPRAQKRGSKKGSSHGLDSWTQFSDVNPSLSRGVLEDIRSSSFPNQDSYFDPFASPLFFFRTPHLTHHDPLTSDDIHLDSAVQPSFVSRRKAHLRYPPTGSGLSLPRTRITVGSTSPFTDQGKELVALMKRSMVMSAQRAKEEAKGEFPTYDNDESASEEQDRAFIEGARAEAEREISLVEVPRIGLWSAAPLSGSYEDDLKNVGVWFRQALRFAS